MSSNSNHAAESNGAYQAGLPVRERRLVDRLGYYWREVSNRGGFPSVDDIDPWMIGDDWKDCLLIQPSSPVNASRLLAVGEHLVADPHRQLRDFAIADVPPDSLVSLIASHLERVLSIRHYVVDEGATRHAGAMILYRCTLLPLAADGTTIDHVLAAVDFKFVDPARRPLFC
jgi:PAS fold